MDAGLNAFFLDKESLDLPEILNKVYFGDGFCQKFEDACGSVALDRYGPPNDEDGDLGPYEVWRPRWPVAD